jgi:transcriptional regulator with XRE-family HTH domain
VIDPKVFKQVRKALGLSQDQLATALGLSRITINKMERGKLRRGIPDEVADRLLALKNGAQVKVYVAAPSPLPNWHPEWKDDAHLWDNEEDDS